MPAAKFEITRQCKVCGETFVAKTIESVLLSQMFQNCMETTQG